MDQITYWEEYLAQKRRSGDLKGQQAALNMLGQLLAMTPNFRKAIDYLQECIKIDEILGDWGLYVSRCDQLATLYEFRLNDPQAAIQYLQKAIVHAPDGPSKDICLMTLERLQKK